MKFPWLLWARVLDVQPGWPCLGGGAAATGGSGAAAVAVAIAKHGATASDALDLPAEQPGAGNVVNLRRIALLFVFMYGTVVVLWLVHARFSRNRGGTLSMEGRRSAPLVCLTFASTALGMDMVNRMLVDLMRRPVLIVALQMVMASVVLYFLSWRHLMDARRDQLTLWAIVPVLFTAVLFTSLCVHAYIPPLVLCVVQNLLPLIALPMEVALTPWKKRPRAAGAGCAVTAILVMFAGSLAYAGAGAAEQITGAGIALACWHISVTILDRFLQRRLLVEECKDLPSSVCAFITNVCGVLPVILLALPTHSVAEGQLDSSLMPYSARVPSVMSWTMNGGEYKVLAAAFLSGVVFAGLSWLTCECQRVVSATSFLVLQNAVLAAKAAVGIGFFGDLLRPGLPSPLLGLLTILCGSVAYGRMLGVGMAEDDLGEGKSPATGQDLVMGQWGQPLSV